MQHLLLLHGAIGAKDQLEPLANELTKDFTVHTLNFTGHGGNAIPQEPFSMEMFANDVFRYLDDQKILTVNIFGYSMGGYAGMYLARHHAEKINKLITLATKFEWNAEIAAREIKMLDAVKIEEKIPQFAKQLTQRHQPQDWKTLLQKTAELLKNLGEKNTITNEDYKLINTSSLIMLGDRDKMVSLDETLNVYRELPNAQLGILPATSHPLEQADIKMISFMIAKFLR